MNTPATPQSPLRMVMLITLPIVGILLAIIIALVMRKPHDNARVTVVVTDGQPGLDVNTGAILDATVTDQPVLPRVGYRYKVFVDDESDDRSSGIAKIGGRATFIPGARRGQTAIVDVTRVRDRAVDAIMVKVLSEVALPPKVLRPAFVPQPGDSAAHVMPGAEMDVVITEASERNPDTEGVAKVSGLVVFVRGATQIGERVNVRITERREKMAFAMLTGKPAGTEPLPAATPDRPAYVPPPGDPVVVGAEMDVQITEASEKNPDTEGVARIGGLVVFVKGVTAIGERVNVRIVERRPKSAFAEPTGKPAGAAPLASQGTTGDILRRAFTPKAGDPAGHVIAGAEMDVVITEASQQRPGQEGVAKVAGLVVFVDGATTIGERVNVRITARRERMAFAELTGKPAGTEPLPAAAPSAPPPPPRPYVPPADDATAFIVPSAVISATISEASEKNPETEGVARVAGLVVSVKGATTIGETVNVRITERRRSMALGEKTTDAVTAHPAD